MSNQKNLIILHILVTTILMAALTLLYYKWQDWFSWFWDYFSFEYQYKAIGALFVIPFIYASVLSVRRLAFVVWCVSLVCLLPRLLFYYGMTGNAIILNLVVLSVPLLVMLIITVELNWRRKQIEVAKRVEAERQLFTLQIMKAQEDERRRIAQELHDDTIQELLVIANRMEDLIIKIKRNEHFNLLEKTEWIRDRTVLLSNNVRRLSLDLVPSVLDDLGLVPAVIWLAERLNEENNIKAKVTVDGEYVSKMFSTDTELGILRIVQETISNIRRHSMAANVQILLECKNSSLSITIADDGKGFILPENISDLARDGKMGLMNMQQRAKFLNGDLTISSVPDAGTRVSLTVAKQQAKE